LAEIQIVFLPNNGILLLNGTPVTEGQIISINDISNLTFVPEENFNGAVSFDWNGSDGIDFAFEPAQVYIDIDPINDLPTNEDIDVSGVEDEPIQFNNEQFEEAFSDIEDSPFTEIVIVSLPENGTLYLNGVPVEEGDIISVEDIDGLTFVPDAGFDGETSFEWKGSDGEAYAETPANVNIDIEPINDGSEVSDFAKTVEEDETLTFTPEDFTSHFTDIDGDELVEVKILTLPDNGTLFLNGEPIEAGQEIPASELGNITFVPDANFNGETSFTWTGSDGQGYASPTAETTITVTPVNDLPTNEDVEKSGIEGSPITFTEEDFTNEFEDVDGDELVEIQIVSLPDNGTLLLNGEPVTEGQIISINELENLTFVPEDDFTGEASFEWIGLDGTNYAEEPANVNIEISPIDNTLVVTDFEKTGEEDTAIAFTAEDFTNHFDNPKDNPLKTVKILSLPDNGTLYINGVPVLVGHEIELEDLVGLLFVPSANFNGQTSFEWTATDASNFASPIAQAIINITPVNDAPEVDDNKISVNEGENGKLDLLAPTDDDGEGLSIVITGLPEVGIVTLEDGTPVTEGMVLSPAQLVGLIYIAPEEYNNEEVGTFTYNVSDGTVTVEGTVEIIVVPINDAPIVDNNNITVNEGGNGGLGLTPPTDPDGNPLTITVTELPNVGTITLADGTPVTIGMTLTPEQLEGLIYTAPDNYNGTSEVGDFGYSVSDGTITVNGTVGITVNPDNDAPVVDSNNITVNEGGNDGLGLTPPTDIDGNPLTITVTTLPTIGTITLANGTPVTIGMVLTPEQLSGLIYIAPDDYNGSDSIGNFGYSVSDGTVSVTGTVTIAVTPVNDSPIVDSNVITVKEDETGALGLTALTDIDGNPLTITVTTLPTIGTVTLANGTPVTVGMTLTPAQLEGLIYVAPDNYNGTDNVGDFVYSVSDGTVTVEGIVDIIVTPVDDDKPEMIVKGNNVEIVNQDAIAYDNNNTLFPSTDATTGSVTHQFTIQNLANGALQLSSTPIVEIIGEHPNDFVVSVQPNKTSLAKDETVTFSITFNPLEAGDRRAIVRIANNDDNKNPYEFAIKGEAIEEFIVYEGITPNGDGNNDSWVIRGIEQFPNNRVVVWNCWGNIVFEQKGYNNTDKVWRAETNVSLVLEENEVPDGTYFYVIEFNDGNTPSKSGYLVVKK
jgi:gliding motility-associated-like protein